MTTTQTPAPATATTSEHDDDVIIETRNLSKTYRDFWGRQKVRALKASTWKFVAAKYSVSWVRTVPANRRRLNCSWDCCFPPVARHWSSARIRRTCGRTNASVSCRRNRICTSSSRPKKRLTSMVDCLTCRPTCRKKRTDELINMVGLAGSQAAAERVFQRHDATHRIGPSTDQRS